MTPHRFLPALLVLALSSAPTFSQVSYTDDADGRRLADIRFETVDDGSAVRLRMVVSAVGADVEGVSGFEGVSGANRFTSEQLGNILAGSRRFAVMSRNTTTGSISVGEFRAGRKGYLRMRRMRADGSIDYLARTPRRMPLELVVETGSLTDVGRYETELRVDGKTRGRVTAVVRPTREVALEGFESLGGHAEEGHPAAGPALAARGGPYFLLQAGLLEPEAVAANPVKMVDVDPADWAKRDMEGKWALYQRWIAPSPALREGWVPFLVAQMDYAFLEWLALYQVDGFSSQGVGQALVDAGAPQWARVAHWMRNSRSGHGEMSALAILLKRPGETLWWLQKYPEAAKDLPSIVESLAKEKTQPVEAPHLLPPLKAQEVFGPLDAPAELAVLGERTTAEAGKVYEQQVVRAIRAYIAAGHADAQWEAKLRALTRHGNLTVRREALLAYTHRGVGALDPQDTLRVIDDTREAAAVREAAALAFSYIDHPMVYVKLHGIAGEVEHPAWSAAVSRLGDVGDGFSADILGRVSGLPSPKDKIVADARQRIANRFASEQSNLKQGQYPAETLEKNLHLRLARAAWADAHRDPLAAGLLTWTHDHTRMQAAQHKAVHAVVVRLATGDSAALTAATLTPAWRELNDPVRRLAAEIVR